jgi:hypothetical protein
MSVKAKTKSSIKYFPNGSTIKNIAIISIEVNPILLDRKDEIIFNILNIFAK